MKVAVIGLGSAGLRHAANLAELGHEPIGFDPAPQADPRAGARPAPGFERAGSLADAIHEAEAVIVASPNVEHAGQAIAALEAGRPVLVEKPLAVTLQDAEAIAAAAHSAGVTCAVAMNLRFHPAILRLRKLLEDGELGEPLTAHASFGYDLRRWRPGVDYRQTYSARAELGGGILLDAVHELDYLLWLLGPVADVTASVDRVSGLEIDVEDLVLATLRFRSGVRGLVDLNYFEPAYRRGCLLCGDAGVARWDWGEGSIRVRRSDREDDLIDVAADVSATYRAELSDFFAALEGGSSPRTPVDQGVEAIRLADAIRRSSADGEVVKVA
jgi:predicted dehydrogenase